MSPDVNADAERDHEQDRQDEQGERLAGAQHEGDRLVIVVVVFCLFSLQVDYLRFRFLQLEKCQKSLANNTYSSFVRKGPDSYADRQKGGEGDDGAVINWISGDVNLEPDLINCSVIQRLILLISILF